jgi:hypothetical protein
MKDETKKVPLEVPLQTQKEVPEITPKKAPLVEPKAISSKKSVKHK